LESWRGTPVELYTLSDGAYEVRIATYGGIVVSLKAPDRNGKSADVALGFDDVDGYVANFNGPSDAFLGAIIGRYANYTGTDPDLSAIPFSLCEHFCSDLLNPDLLMSNCSGAPGISMRICVRVHTA
jgi:hypothetical protein